MWKLSVGHLSSIPILVLFFPRWMGCKYFITVYLLWNKKRRQTVVYVTNYVVCCCSFGGDTKLNVDVLFCLPTNCACLSCELLRFYKGNLQYSYFLISTSCNIFLLPNCPILIRSGRNLHVSISHNSTHAPMPEKHDVIM